MKFTISILCGDDAHRCRIDSEFVHAWSNLAERTPHVTVFQEPEFVNTWYQEYESNFEPVLILAYTEHKRLVGLLPLTMEKNNRELGFAGAQHLEYSGWLCDPRCELDFITSALSAIAEKFEFSSWQWAHLPPGADDSWLKSTQLEVSGLYALSNKYDCPILDLHDEDKLNKILKNKSVKSKINRLKRQGALRLERIVNSERVAQLMDHISDLVNFRHESAHHDAAFEEEPIQKDFYLARGDLPSANHFTVLWMGDTLLAFNFGVKSNDTVFIGLTAFDPVQSKHSPGVIFLIYLAELLKEENIRYIDFTPGGDEYKERFCNTYNILQRPVIYSSRTRKTMSAVNKRIRSIVTRPAHALLTNWRNAMQELVKLPGKNSEYKETMDLYYIHHDMYQNLDSRASQRVNIQIFQDLLIYKNKESKIARQRVLSDATKRFSREETLFTLRNGDDLLAHAWMSKPGSKYNNHAIQYNTDSMCVVLDCMNLNLKLPNGPIFKSIVNSMLEYAFSNSIKSAFIFIPKVHERKIHTKILKELNFKKRIRSA